MATLTPQAAVGAIRTISRPEQRFCGWPTLARRRDGQLLAVCSGGRDFHVCPFGQVHLIRSDDGGRTWSAHEVLADGPLDDRDAGVMETSNGTLLVNWFTSLAWEVSLQGVERDDPESKKRRQWSRFMRENPETLARWRARRDALTEDIRQREMGAWMIRSEDGGQTWSDRIATLVNSPHGPTEMSDGRLVYIGKYAGVGSGASANGSPFPDGRLAVSESRDDGRTWQLIGDVPAARGQTTADYHEPHAVEAADGRLIAHIRDHSTTPPQTLQTESDDGGRTWTLPYSLEVRGYPSHLLRPRDDRLVMSYGQRGGPWGVQARVSEDHGCTWSGPIVLHEKEQRRDIGYPSTVQMEDDTLLTVWYEEQGTDPEPPAVLREVGWSMDQ